MTEHPMPTGARSREKWDRAARFLKIARILYAHREGITAQALADQVGFSKRTVYRDLQAMDLYAELPIWQDGGRWGLEEGAFLPPLDLTLHEAATLFLAARLLAKSSDEHDTELIGTFVKLAAVLPTVLAEHIATVADLFADTPRNERFTRVFRILTEAWAGRRVVEIEYESGVYEGGRRMRRTRVRPYLIEPSALTHALYLIGYDEERGGRRTFKVERIVDASLTPERFEPEPGVVPADLLRQAWDVIADQPLESVRLRFAPAVASRVAETRWHPTQVLEPQPDGSLLWSGSVAGWQEIRIWILGWGDEVEVLAPADLRADVAAALRRAASTYD